MYTGSFVGSVRCVEETVTTPPPRPPLVSFEFFPPKTPDAEGRLWQTIKRLEPLGPRFVSVTYGAGGSTRARTLEVTKWLKQDLGLAAMAHLTCVGAPRDDVRAVLDELVDAGLVNGLALRRDPRRGEAGGSGLSNSLQKSMPSARKSSAYFDLPVTLAWRSEVI